MNSIQILGNLTADVVRKDFNDKCKMSFTLAHNQGDRTSFIPVEAWNQPHLEEYLGKGSKVAVEGQLRQDHWQTEAGEKRNRLYVHANTVHFVEMKSPSGGGSAKPAAKSGKPSGNSRESGKFR